MSSVTAWIRRRLDSSGSADGATTGVAYNEECGGAAIPSAEEDDAQLPSHSHSQRNSFSWSRKGQRRQTEPPNVTFVIETTDRTVGRRARHLSIGDANAAGLPQKEEVGSVYVRVNRSEVLLTNKRKNKVNPIRNQNQNAMDMFSLHFHFLFLFCVNRKIVVGFFFFICSTS